MTQLEARYASHRYPDFPDTKVSQTPGMYEEETWKLVDLVLLTSAISHLSTPKTPTRPRRKWSATMSGVVCKIITCTRDDEATWRTIVDAMLADSTR
jgi:hypothetical protein